MKPRSRNPFPVGQPKTTRSFPQRSPSTTESSTSSWRNRLSWPLALVLFGLLRITIKHMTLSPSTSPPSPGLSVSSNAAPTAAQVLPDEPLPDVVAQVSEPEEPSPTVVGPLLTVISGTHGFDHVLEQQDEDCLLVADQVHKLWTSWDTTTYMVAKSDLEATLKKIADLNKQCVLNGSPSQDQVWSFPIAYSPNTKCKDPEDTMMIKKKPWTKTTKVFAPWFLLRPDLVTLEKMATQVGVNTEFHVTVGHDYVSAAFNLEVGCPRFRTVLKKRDVYKQRLLLVSVSDIQYQLRKLQGKSTVVHVCSQHVLNDDGITEDNGDSVSFWKRGTPATGSVECDARSAFVAPTGKTHLASITMLQPFLNQKLKKTVFDGPTLVFVAGLEGVGHHMFSSLGRKHTFRYLYDALTDHLCNSAWQDNSERAYATARNGLVQAMARIKSQSAMDVVFLNTIFTEQPVNMYSLPWGGPRCYLKRYARIMCNVDVIELARMAEEAGVDFRIIVAKRSIGAAVVSASLHRPFGTLVSETRMLIESWALLRSALQALDDRFYIEVNYEDLMRDPSGSAKQMAEHIRAAPGSKLSDQFHKELVKSAQEHPPSAVDKWKKEISNDDDVFMTDLLYLDQ